MPRVGGGEGKQTTLVIALKGAAALGFDLFVVHEENLLPSSGKAT